MKFITDLLRKFPELSSGKKKIIVFFSLGMVVVLLGSMFYFSRKPSTSTGSGEGIKFEEVVPEVRLLGKSLYQETTLKTRRLEQSLNELKQELKKMKTHVERTREEQQKRVEKKLENLRKMLEKQIKTTEKGGERKKSVKEQKFSSSRKEKRESGPGRVYVYTPPEVSHKPGESPTPRWVGGIMKLKDTRTKKKESRKKEKEQLTVYLPPSFVSGTLLTGLSAFVSQEGQGEPARVLVRLDDLAVLPNEVKADLRGCFVIGEAYGNLADEKIHIRLLRLSCVARDGKSVIDEKITGWVVDGDTGETGLRGTPVAKFGSFVARYALAGFFEGFGEAYSSSQNFIDFSTGGGITQLPSPGKAVEAGLGKGIAKAGKGLGDFYLKLAQQTLPVIEAGTGKRVTVVFSKGVELKLRNVCLKGRDGCKIKPVTGVSVLGMIQ